MQIITNTTIDPHGVGTWAVMAEWMGAVRPVFTGNVFECGQFVRNHH